MVPEKIPPGGKWMPGEWTLVVEYMKEVGADYYIGGTSAFQYYGLTTQIPQGVTVYNDKISGTRTLGNISAQFIRVAKKRIGGVVELTLPTGGEARISTLPRTLVDALYDWSRYNSIPQVFQWIKDRSNDRTFLGELISMAIQYGNLSVRRRLGYLLETMGADTSLIRRIRKETPVQSGRIPFIPTLPAKGQVNSKWGLIVNG
jgi:predicted transcriptional regulator of viral defense system